MALVESLMQNLGMNAARTQDSIYRTIVGPAFDPMNYTAQLQAKHEPVTEPVAVAVIEDHTTFPQLRAALDEYRRAATEIGFENDALRIAEFRLFLAEESIFIYNTEHVMRFLHSIMPEGMRLEWKALRAGDVVPRFSASSFMTGIYESPRYTKPVPLNALKLVKRISDKFPDAKFYVSDWVEHRPDPFLQVEYGGKAFIVYHWDEPKFDILPSLRALEP